MSTQQNNGNLEGQVTMISLTKWASAAVVAGAMLVSPQAMAIPLGTDASVKVGGSYEYNSDSQELTVNLTAAFDGQGELEAVNGSFPDPAVSVFQIVDGAELLFLDFDRSRINSDFTETGRFRFTIADIIHFDPSSLTSSLWYIELQVLVEDVSDVRVYDNGLLVPVLIGKDNNPFATTPNSIDEIQVVIGSGFGVVSTDVPEAGPLALLAGGLAGLALVRRGRQNA
jgi:hypothetical protein